MLGMIIGWWIWGGFEISFMNLVYLVTLWNGRGLHRISLFEEHLHCHFVLRCCMPHWQRDQNRVFCVHASFIDGMAPR